MNSRTRALLALVTASFLWSTAGIVGKLLLVYYTPFSLALIRYLLASLMILPFFLRQPKQPLQKLLKYTLPVGLFSAGNIAFYYLGLIRTTVSASVIIYTAAPFIVAIISKYTLGEHLTRKKLSGITLGFIGVLITVLVPLFEKQQTSAGDFLGNLFIVCATISFAFYTISSRYLIDMKKFSPLSITSITLFITAVVFFVLTIFFPPKSISSQILSSKNLLLLLFLAFFVTVATYLLYQWAIKHSSSTTASLTVYLQPVLAVGLAILLLSERFTITFLLGSLLVMIGLLLFTGTKAFTALRDLFLLIRFK